MNEAAFSCVPGSRNSLFASRNFGQQLKSHKIFQFRGTFGVGSPSSSLGHLLPRAMIRRRFCCQTVENNILHTAVPQVTVADDLSSLTSSFFD